ncbi:MAG: hypothetical protein K8T89_13705 [Planctomycetes bacterium]|nr:hypothetical protein [Planctomycetota bacterium]
MKWVRTLLPRILLTAAIASLVVAGVLAVGSWLRDGPARERSKFSISEVECDPPAGQTREAFLGQVHYYGQLPEKLSTLDADMPDRLRTAFGRHPKVERVGNVAINPPNRVRVEIYYRDDSR